MMGIVDKMGLPDNMPIDAKILSNSIESAQKRLEGMHFRSRKNVLMYDDVMNQQRNVIYKQRREVIDGLDLSEKIRTMIDQSVEKYFMESFDGAEPENWSFDEFKRRFPMLCTPEDLKYTVAELEELDKDELCQSFVDRAHRVYRSKEEQYGAELMREAERSVLLHNVDEKWMEHIDAMDDLKGSISLQSYGGRDPLVEYKSVGGVMFSEMVDSMCDDTVSVLMNLTVVKRGEGEAAPLERRNVAKITSEGRAKTADNFSQAQGAGGDTSLKNTPVRKTEKVGRNDPCPCGSGKKYKKCCGASSAAEE
jgi:preprotein translocase subunit SecA